MASKSEKKESSFKQQYLSSFQLRILEKLKELGPLTRDQLCEEFGFKKRKVKQIDKYLLRERGLNYSIVIERYDKRTTIHDNIVKLQEKKLVEKFSKSNGKRGRPPVFYKLKKGGK